MQNEQNSQNMVEQIATILAYVKGIDKKLETIMEDNVSLNNSNIVGLYQITTVEALQKIETKLLNATFEKQVVCNIINITLITRLLTPIKCIFGSILLHKMVVLILSNSQKKYSPELLPTN